MGVDSVLVYGRDSGNHITDGPSAPLDPWDHSRQWAVNRNMGVTSMLHHGGEEAKSVGWCSVKMEGLSARVPE